MTTSHQMIQNMYKELKDKVRYVLVREEEARDSDELLYMELLKLFYDVSSEASMIKVIMDKKLPKFSSVSRARRLIQNRNPSLRGEKKRKGQVDKMERVHRDVMTTF